MIDLDHHMRSIRAFATSFVLAGVSLADIEAILRIFVLILSAAGLLYGGWQTIQAKRANKAAEEEKAK